MQHKRQCNAMHRRFFCAKMKMDGMNRKIRKRLRKIRKG